jgi:hypothetical protein
MRPVFLLLIMLAVRPLHLLADDPLVLVLRLPGWPLASLSKGFQWTAFTRSYFCLSNWNASGAGIAYGTGRGISSVLVYREGISGYSDYHLLLSHCVSGKTFGGTLQLGFSIIAVSGSRPVFRTSADIQTSCKLGDALEAEAIVWDLPGWLFPGNAVTRGNPAMQLLLFHDPGKPVRLTGGFRMAPGHFGPLTAGIRLVINDRLAMDGFFDLLPLGTTISVDWRLEKVSVRISAARIAGTGMTPTARLQGSLGK